MEQLKKELKSLKRKYLTLFSISMTSYGLGILVPILKLLKVITFQYGALFTALGAVFLLFAFLYKNKHRDLDWCIKDFDFKIKGLSGSASNVKDYLDNPQRYWARPLGHYAKLSFHSVKGDYLVQDPYEFAIDIDRDILEYNIKMGKKHFKRILYNKMKEYYKECVISAI